MSHVSVPQPPVGAMSNTYAGKCCGCDAWVAAGFGTTQRKVRRWLTYCTTCKPVVRQAAPVPLPVDTSEHVCWGAHRRTVYDARGIYAFSCCAICEQEKRARFRPEVFTDANYQCDEPIEED